MIDGAGDLFDARLNVDSAFNVLTLHVMVEIGKGPESTHYLYFKTAGQGHLVCEYTKEELKYVRFPLIKE